MNAYRKNAKERAAMEADQRGFWRSAYRRAAARGLLVGGIIVGCGAAYAIGMRFRQPPLPPACEDTSTVIGGSRSEQSCSTEQHMDTTRIREGEATYVIVRCWCPGHGPTTSDDGRGAP